MTVENARKKLILSKYVANYLGNNIAMTVDNAFYQSTCFCGAFDIVFCDHKSFIMCQHLIVYLSHFTIVCSIIAINHIPESHTNLLYQFNCYALGCLVVCCKQVDEQMVQIFCVTLLALLVIGH